jgi:hypothetical protein
MAILPDDVKIELSSAKAHYEPAVIFRRFYIASEDRKVTAARVRGENLDKVRKFWTKAEVEEGDWIVLELNGNIRVMKDDAFIDLLAN